MSEEFLTAEEQLRKEIASLPVDEILALCYAFRHQTGRLRLYLDLLRGRGGERAQFASTLICYDLARQGDEAAQTDFIYLSDTMKELASREGMVEALVGGDDYLSFLWDLCEVQLEEMDPRGDAQQHEVVDDANLVSFDLLDDDDFGSEFDIGESDTDKVLRFDAVLDEFLGESNHTPVYDPTSGFRMHSRHDVDRIEKFLQELDSLRDFVPMARGYRALILLFYGIHLRSRNLFGTINNRKELLLQEGLREFIDYGPDMARVAGVLSEMYAPPEVWEKISDLILDYLGWVAEFPERISLGTGMYPALERLSNRQSFLGNRRRTRRD
ncbi:hypothetical protein KAI87_15305 [Myxococcota bacterium]|nr:hypothetical protein [Myxococcota bacterium]